MKKLVKGVMTGDASGDRGKYESSAPDRNLTFRPGTANPPTGTVGMAMIDPPVSEAQRGAMQAAAAGKSTLGIPQKVGREYAKSDKGGRLPARKGR